MKECFSANYLTEKYKLRLTNNHATPSSLNPLLPGLMFGLSVSKSLFGGQNLFNSGAAFVLEGNN